MSSVSEIGRDWFESKACAAFEYVSSAAGAAGLPCRGGGLNFPARTRSFHVFCFRDRQRLVRIQSLRCLRVCFQRGGRCWAALPGRWTKLSRPYAELPCLLFPRSAETGSNPKPALPSSMFPARRALLGCLAGEVD